MAPQQPSSSASLPRRLSNVLTTAGISTATSPLQASFNLTCRSPLRPLHDANGARNIYSRNSAEAGHSRLLHLEPPRSQGTLRFPGDEEHDPGGDTDSSNSPIDETWPHTPPPPSLLDWPANDEGKLGITSAISIIVGKMVGASAYTISPAVFTGVGSVGMTLLVWVIGALISFCGLAVYLDLGTAMPRSGGERVYLERIFRRPFMLATCMFMSYVVLLGFSTPNAMVLGKYVLLALGIKENTWNARFLAVYSVTGICWLHATHPKLGLRLVNLLSAANMVIFAIVIVSGVAGGLMQVGIDRELLIPGMEAPFSNMSPRSTAQRNFNDIWANSSAQPYDFATALLKVIYCFRGYNTVNQVLSDVKNPVRTLKIAAPIALSLVSVTYLLLNIAFFLVVDKDEFHNAGETVAAIFFQKVFGSTVGTHVLPLFVVFSAAGSITATSYAQARVNETLAKDGLLPWSSFWTSKPPSILHTELNTECRPSYSRISAPASSTPSKGLLLHWLVSTLAIVCPPPGPIYNFLVNLGGYPVSIISVAVSTGLLYLQTSPSEQWTSPVRAPRWMVVIFAVFNCLLCIIPLLRPGDGHKDEDGFVWFAYPVTGLGILGLGAVWWVWWSWFGKGAEQKTERNEEEEMLLRVQEDDEVSLEMEEYAENGEESVLVP